MPIPTESLQALDDAVSRLAAESMLAMAGRDDGMIPSYSLLGEMRELCASEPALCGPVTAVHAELDKLLESAKPFDEAVLGRVRRLAEWMPGAVTCVESAQPVPLLEQAAPGTKSAAAPAGGHGAEVAADSLLSLNLEENRELLTEFHAEAVDHLQQIEAALLELEHRPNNQEALSSIFRSFPTIKGNAGFLGLGPMQSLAHEVESLLDLARNGRLVLSSPIITEILASRDALQAHTQQVAVALEKGQLPDRVVPVSHLILAVKRLAAGGNPESKPAAPVKSEPARFEEAAAAAPIPPTAPVLSAVPESAPQPAARAAGPEAHAAGASQTVRVNTEKLDSLMDVVGELVIVQSQLIESTRGVGDGGSPLQRNVAQLSRITKELQHTAMALRMIPIKPTFQKMERLARDLARDFGKKVAFSTSGDETELDRTVVEQIGDPLVHMVRNALDHGLEPGADRVARGKPEEGTLHLSAYHQGSNLVIELQDNGRGIDPEKILAKAKRQGLVPENALPDRNEIFNLIFLPGFSTAEKVTAVSGRGVGMDVVRRNIEKLRGKIEISSEVGIGSTFKIKLPLTMAIIDGLVVRVGEDRFILPATSVQRALKPSKEHISTIHGQGEVLDVRGHLMPIHRLHRRLGIPADAQQPWDGIVVIVEHSGKVSALLVDEMVSKQEVVIKNLGACMQGLPGIAGGAILGDGNIALILDPGTLLQAA
jgi:two-component system, chemotaxis family, sensor kinase CheA